MANGPQGGRQSPPQSFGRRRHTANCRRRRAALSLSLALCLCIFLMCNANILKSRAGAKELLIYGCHKIVLLHCLSNGNRFMASLMQANFN